MASYYAPDGHYSITGRAFATAVDNAPLHAIANGASANGVYAYSRPSTFPSDTYSAANYWVDVMFADPGARPGDRRDGDGRRRDVGAPSRGRPRRPAARPPPTS